MGKKENIRLTEKVEIISYGSTSDGAGGTIPVKQVLFEMYVAIEQLQARKDIEQAQLSCELLSKTCIFDILNNGAWEINQNERL